MSAMGRSGTLQRATSFGRGSVLKRLEVGANRKDLFYYLVRPTRLLFRQHAHFIGIGYRAAKSSPRPSDPLSMILHKMGR